MFMNTDNVTSSGETIDYGPCAFMDNFNMSQYLVQLIGKVDTHLVINQ